MLTLLRQNLPDVTPKLEVLLVLFPGFNTLDMNGPFDVLSKSGTSTSFSIQVASESTDHCGVTKATEGVKVQVWALIHAFTSYLGKSGYPRADNLSA